MSRFATWLQWFGLPANDSVSQRFCRQIVESGLGILLHRLPRGQSLYGAGRDGYLRAYAAAVVREEIDALDVPMNMRRHVSDLATGQLVELAGVELERYAARPKPARMAA